MRIAPPSVCDSIAKQREYSGKVASDHLGERRRDTLVAHLAPVRPARLSKSIIAPRSRLPLLATPSWRLVGAGRMVENAGSGGLSPFLWERPYETVHDSCRRRNRAC